jgi:hypothetical protein
VDVRPKPAPMIFRGAIFTAIDKNNVLKKKEKRRRE